MIRCLTRGSRGFLILQALFMVYVLFLGAPSETEGAGIQQSVFDRLSDSNRIQTLQEWVQDTEELESQHPKDNSGRSRPVYFSVSIIFMIAVFVSILILAYRTIG